MKTYNSYRNLPSLAGVCSMEEATKAGLSVEACVARLKRYHYAFKRLHEIFTCRLTAEPIYELKMAFSLHAHYCAEHCSAVRERVAEMRTPPLGLEKIPDDLSNYIAFKHPWGNIILDPFVLILMFFGLVIATIIALRAQDIL